MKILPSDLGEERTVAIIQMRALSASGMAGNSGRTAAATAVNDGRWEAAPQKRAGWWTRFCTGGINLSPGAAREVMRGGMNGVMGGIAGGLGGTSMGLLAPGLGMILSGRDSLAIVGATFFVTGLGLLATGLFLPRELITKYANRPLTFVEAQNCAEAAKEATEKAYWSLIAEALRQPSFPNKQTENDMQAALQTLGAAIDKLPRVSAVSQMPPETLQAEAQKAYAEADAEADPIIAASFRRRADAQTKTAQATQRTALLVRRSDALRREIEAQIEALRTGLSGFDGGFADVAQNQNAAQNAAAHLNQLAQSVQSVAREAGSLLDARDEVGAWTNPQTINPVPPTRPNETPEANVVTLGRTNR